MLRPTVPSAENRPGSRVARWATIGSLAGLAISGCVGSASAPARGYPIGGATIAKYVQCPSGWTVTTNIDYNVTEQALNTSEPCSSYSFKDYNYIDVDVGYLGESKSGKDPATYSFVFTKIQDKDVVTIFPGSKKSETLAATDITNLSETTNGMKNKEINTSDVTSNVVLFNVTEGGESVNVYLTAKSGVPTFEAQWANLDKG